MASIKLRQIFSDTFLLIFFFSYVLIGCHPPTKSTTFSPVSHFGPSQKFNSPDELIQSTLLTNDGYGTLTTVHQVSLEIALDGGRKENKTFRGLLAIRRPNFFRLTILGPMDIKIMDILYANGKHQLVYLAPQLQESSQLAGIASSIAGDIAAIYRLDPQPTVVRRIWVEDKIKSNDHAPIYRVKEFSSPKMDEPIRDLTIYAATLAIERMEYLDKDKYSRVITYADYQRNNTLLMPRRINLVKNGPIYYWLSIVVDSVIIDQPLDDNLFKAE